MSSLDPCPSAPSGEVGYAVIDVTSAAGEQTDGEWIPLDSSGAWRWSSPWDFSWVPGDYTVSVSCRHGEAGASSDDYVEAARYAPLSYRVETTGYAPLTVAPSTMTKEGVLHVASSVPCPAGGSTVEVTSYHQSVSLSTDSVTTQVVADADGRWDAYLDFTPLAGKVWPRKAGIHAVCRSATFRANDVPRMTYDWGYLDLKVPAVRLVALGDSYSSGEGNPPFDSATGDCHVSATSAWPYLLDGQMAADLRLEKNLACSGATTSALTSSFKHQSPQLDALVSYTPAVVTITIGGNDVGFRDILADCYKSVTAKKGCDRNGRLTQATKAVGDLGKRLPGVYRSVADHVSKGTAVVVVGYPQLFPDKQSKVTHCAWLSDGERKGLNKLAVTMNKTLDQATQAAFPTDWEYVSQLSALKGHELCTKDAWVYRLAPTGGDLRGHPTAKGQAAMAERVAHYIGPFSDEQFCGCDEAGARRQATTSGPAALREERLTDRVARTNGVSAPGR